MKILFFSSSQYRRERKLVGSLLAGWDFLPCVTVSVIAMSHFKDFMWVDGWSATRERPVVKIPINEGQRNMTWTASGPYLPATQPVDWNCIPSALGHGSALNVSTGILPSPRIPAHARERTFRSPCCTYLPLDEFTNFRGEWAPAPQTLSVIKSCKVEPKLDTLVGSSFPFPLSSHDKLVNLFSNHIRLIKKYFLKPAKLHQKLYSFSVFNFCFYLFDCVCKRDGTKFIKNFVWYWNIPSVTLFF